MTATIRIAIADTNPIIRLGLEAQLKKLPRYKVHVSYISEESRKDWTEALALTVADIYILNPMLYGLQPKQHLPQKLDAMVIALSYGTVDDSLLKGYDGILHITDNMQRITELLDRLVEQEDKGHQESHELTAREREIVVCVVKGMTNKRIAEHLFLSTHTVITHRRNIGKKLQIHSASALAVYAIMNRLIDPNDINVLSKTK